MYHTILKKKFVSYNITKFESSSINKFDIIINPSFRGQFGSYDNVVRAQINLIPEIRTSFLQGMNILAQIILPIYNEFPGEGDYIRPGIISLNQNFRFWENVFISSSIGYCSENRYGFDLSLRKICFNGKFMLGWNIGYTGFLSMYDRKIFYSEMYLLTTNMNFEYRINKYDLQLELWLENFYIMTRALE